MFFLSRLMVFFIVLSIRFKMSHTILKMNLWFSIESIHFGSPSQESLSQGKGIASVPSYITSNNHPSNPHSYPFPTIDVLFPLIG